MTHLLRDRHVFYVTATGNFNIFNTLTLKQIFWKSETFLKKLELHFLVARTKIDKATFPYKTALSEANVITNRIESTQRTYHKVRYFASNYFIFWKFCVRRRASCKELIWWPTTQMSIFMLFVSAGVLFEGGFCLWLLSLIHKRPIFSSYMMLCVIWCHLCNL